MSKSSIGISRLKENNEKDLNSLCKILIGLIESVLSNSNDFKRLNLESEIISNQLLPFSGGLETLFDLGYQEGEDYFFLPSNFDRNKFKEILNELKNLTQGSNLCNPNRVCASTIGSTRPEFGLKNPKNSLFASRLQSSFDFVLIYENSELKQKCLSKIPVDRLRSQVDRKFEAYSNSNQDPVPFDKRDFLILELLAWFKNEFFRWVNAPDCDRCQTNQNMQMSHNDRPNFHEATWMAGSVEVYKCLTCNQTTRFPRYNHPSKLLDTRSGRCGEWANCFCLVLRSLDYDARYILDVTDHVWCEVYSESQKRWMHADPCENCLDKPLLYEHGWGKKLSYVIAFSRYECLDVTWRYSSKHQEVLGRRDRCDEQWLVYYTNYLTKKREAYADRKQRELRLVTELVEFLTPKQAKEGEDIGRQSGSLQWRLERGEIQVPSEVQNGFKIKVDSIPFRLKYNTVRDVYQTEGSSGVKEVPDWKQMTFKHSNVLYKVEHDWKMCYLAREKGPDIGFIEWHFDGDASKLERVELVFDWSVFESGQVDLKLSSLDSNGSKSSELILDKNRGKISAEKFGYEVQEDKFVIRFNSEDVYGLVLRVELSKGNGSNAFQHAQLFRQSLNDTYKFLFDIKFF